MTYDEFLATIKEYTIRDDAPISGFIRRSETFLRTIIRHYLSEKTVTLSVVDSTAELPSDFIEIRAISGAAKTFKRVSPTNAKLTSDQVGYFRVGDSLIFVGGEDMQIELIYSASFPDLSATQTNWLFDRFPNVYISAVLKEFHRWQQSAEGVQIESAALQEALAIVAEDDRRGRSSPIIMGDTSW